MLEEKFCIAGYCRISVDDELDRDNTSIENQRAIISDYVSRKFPNATLDFYDDRDRSGYTFEQREGYQKLRPMLLDHTYDILIVKDFSRFSRRNSKGLVELEDLRDAGLRIIAIGDSIDYPTYDDWTSIQFRFLINEMPVTDTSKKVKSVIKRRQAEGKWICSVPYGYVITNSKTMDFTVEDAAAAVIRKIFELYNGGWGYKKIANYLTDQHIPTPRMSEKLRKEAAGEEYRGKVKENWSIVTVSEILCNDFYIGTLRQGKYTRKKINGSDRKIDESEHIVFENNHESIIDYHTFAVTQEQLKMRTTNNYRGVKKNDNVYSGFLFCGDCGSPMFAMSRSDLKPAYTCGTYHLRGTKGCTSHHIRVDLLDTLLKSYVKRVRDNSAQMIDKLNKSISNERREVRENETTVQMLQEQIDTARAEMKTLIREKTKEILSHPDKEAFYDEMYSELLDEAAGRIAGLENQLKLTADCRNTIIRVNRIAKTALEIFDDVLTKEKLDKTDLSLIIERIVVYEDRVDIQLKSDIDSILKCGSLTENAEEQAANFEQGIINIEKSIVQSSKNHGDKVYDVNVISSGDPLEIYTDSNGEVIFKKYSPIGELEPYTKQYAEVLNRSTNLPVLICDRDHVIAVAGLPRKDALDKRITPMLEDYMERRAGYVLGADGEQLTCADGLERRIGVMAPIIGAGDVMGAVVLLLDEKGSQPSQTDIKLTQVAASFLGKQMEE